MAANIHKRPGEKAEPKNPEAPLVVSVSEQNTLKQQWVMTTDQMPSFVTKLLEYFRTGISVPQICYPMIISFSDT